MSAKDEFARLVDEACRVGGHKTKKEAVTAALNEYIKRRKQMEIISLFGTIDWDPTLTTKPSGGENVGESHLRGVGVAVV